VCGCVGMSMFHVCCTLMVVAFSAKMHLFEKMGDEPFLLLGMCL